MTDDTHAHATTRADVARLAGVSAAVVSYVVNAGPRPVAAATRARVQAAIQTLGYRPNPTARALSRGMSDTFGLLVADSRNPFFAQLIFEVHRVAASQGHSLMTVSTEHSTLSLDEHIDELAARQVRRLISVHPFSERQLARMDGMGMRVVQINQSAHTAGVASVRVDYRRLAAVAVEHLIGHGYRRIAFVGAAEYRGLRESGWADALETAGLRPGPRILTEYSLEGGREAGLRLLQLEPRPDAVFVSSDQMAMGMLAALHAADVHVPRDIALAAFDGTMESAYLWPPLTTIRQPVEEIATRAVAALDESAPDADIVLDAPLIVRTSCGCAWTAGPTTSA